MFITIDTIAILGYMMAAILLLLAILCCSSQHASAFLSPLTKPLEVSCAAQRTSTIESDGFATSRRSFAEDFLGIGSISLAFLSSSTPAAYASGGATAGGAYLLSAKQRYNERKSAFVLGLYVSSFACFCKSQY